MLEDITTIMVHPRYREFAAAVTDRGRQVVPDAYPWKYMGLSDEEFLALPLRFAGGGLMPIEHKRKQLPVLRWAEQNVREWWRWWGGWQWLTKKPPVVTEKRQPGFLF